MVAVELGYVDGYLKTQVVNVKQRIKDKFDCTGVIDGIEGSGKTRFGSQFCYQVDPTFGLDRVVFSPSQFWEKVNESKPGQAIMMDEAMNAFYARAAMSATNISMNRMLAMCRYKRLFLLMCMPSIFEMDRYAAMWRTSFLVHIYTVPNDNREERGYFKWYDRDRKKQLLLIGKKAMDYSQTQPNFFGRFSKKEVFDEEEYEQRKNEGMLQLEQDLRNTKQEIYWHKKFIVAMMLWRKEKGMDYAGFASFLRANNIPFKNSDLSLNMANPFRKVKLDGIEPDQHQ